MLELHAGDYAGFHLTASLPVFLAWKSLLEKSLLVLWLLSKQIALAYRFMLEDVSLNELLSVIRTHDLNYFITSPLYLLHIPLGVGTNILFPKMFVLVLDLDSSGCCKQKQ